jgi:hypothetical protein
VPSSPVSSYDSSSEDEEKKKEEESKEVGGEVKEADLVDMLDAKTKRGKKEETEREEYERVRKEETEAGWSDWREDEKKKREGWKPPPITVEAFVTPPAAPRPVLHGCSTPLDFFQALLPPAFIDYAVEPVTAQGPPRLPSDAVSQKAFRRSLMHALVEGFTARKKRGRPPSTPKLSADEPQHIPRSGLPQRPCISCASKHTKSSGVHKPRTTVGCVTCGVAVHIDEQHAECWREHLPHEEEEENEE